MIIGLMVIGLFVLSFFDPAPKAPKPVRVRVVNKEWKKELHGE